MIRLILIVFVLMPHSLFARDKSLCSINDHRTPTHDLKIGRLSDQFVSYCTVTLISNNCAITAGHCIYFFYKGQIEFDVPQSKGSLISHALPENTYRADTTNMESKDMGLGKDWAIVKLLPNEVTGLLPGEANGYYPVSFLTPSIGEEVTVKGYGKVYNLESNLNGTLQEHTGKILNISTYQYVDSMTHEASPSVKLLEHNVDTTSGNSGSAIIRENQGDIVGIHTHGGVCSETGGNRGTLISETKDLQIAIRKCIDENP